MTRPSRRAACIASLADLEDEIDSPVDFDAWHDLQRWIAGQGETRVAVPFVPGLGDLMPGGAPRLRRDFETLLSLVRAHAILHQAQRETDARGRIVATIDGDYAPVRALVSDLIAEGVEASVSPAIRDTVKAVRALLDQGAEHVSPNAIIEHLDVGRSATYDRIRRAVLKGYLTNAALRGERGMRLVVGAPLPSENDFLPLPEAVVRAMSDRPAGHASGSTEHADDASSGCPVRPDAPETRAEARPFVLACEHLDHREIWLAGDQKWRCVVCGPPVFPGEIIETQHVAL